MKIVVSFGLLLLILTGCSPEPVPPTAEPPAIAFSAGRPSGTPPYATDTPGALYYYLLDTYHAAPVASPTLEQAITACESLAFDNAGLLDLTAYQSLTIPDLAPYTAPGQPDIDTLLSGAYDTASRSVFKAITLELDRLKNENASYDDACGALAAIAQRVAGDNAIQKPQADAILVTTSILQHGLAHEKKRKRRDRDWDWMTTSIAATANAALESQAQAIIVSLVMDIYYD